MALKLVRKFDRPATTEWGLIRKINRRLPEYHKLHKVRPRWRLALGMYYVLNHYNNHIVADHIDDLQEYLAELDTVAA